METREAVASNENAPREVLKKLANDKTDKIREAVARNENTALEILDKLAQDSNRIVRATAKENLQKLYD